MGILSCLRPPVLRITKSAISEAVKASTQKSTTVKNVQFVVVRQMGAHGPAKMVVTPSRAVFNTLKNEFHFFVMLGVIPVVVLITGCNMFIGSGELSDIPEGYQPHHYEYESHPISRFIAKHLSKPFEKQYEQNLSFHALDSEKTQLRKRARKIKEMMAEKQDFKAWYYIPVDKDRIDKAKVYHDIYEKETSKSG